MRSRTLVVLNLWVVFAANIAVAAPAPTLLERVELRGQTEEVEVVVEGKFKIPDYALRSREEGAVVVIEVRNTTLPKGGVAIQGQNPLVQAATASSTALGVRIELKTRKPVTYHARAQRGRIVVKLSPLSADAPAASDSQGMPAKAVTPLKAPEKALQVKDVHIERRDGRERVVIELSRPAEFRVAPDQTGPARLDVRGARLSSSVPKAVQGEADFVIRSVRTKEDSNGVVVEVDRRSGSTGTAIREGSRLVWLFAAGEAEERRPKARTLAREPGSPQRVETETAMAAGFFEGALQVADAKPKNTRFTGRRIDLDFKDADIHNILRLIAEVGGVNVVAGDDVKGTVTIRMRDVPWDQALEVMLQAKGLGMERKANMIRVAPLETLEKEREVAIIRQKQHIELAPLETRLIPVSYAEADKLKPRVGELLTNRGTVSTDERTNVLIVRDLAENLDDTEELVRTLDTQTPQVLVEARIVEATSQYSRDIGIQWGGDMTMGQATGNPTGLAFPSNIGLNGGNYDSNTPTQGLSPVASQVQTPNFAVNLPATTAVGQGGALGLTLGSVGSNFNLNVRLSAAEANGIVRIISSPRILTLDNHEAHIAQGTLIPYSQVSAQGVQTAFQEAKLQLVVKPHVTSDGSVGMHVKVTRDEPDFTRTSSRGDPTILKREAETDLLVDDAHTAVIGGIFTRNSGRNVDQVPLFGDIPILGVLFQRRRVRDERNELLIFLTPRIVNRSQALQR